MEKQRLNCSATYDYVADRWVGRCKQFPDLTYLGRTEEAALSGIRRMAKKKVATASVSPPSGEVVAEFDTRAPRKLRNRVALVLDRSGSMGVIRTAALEAFRRVIDEVRKNAAATGQETRLSIVLFNGEVEWHVVDEPLTPDVGLDGRLYEVVGGTALLDAVGQTLERLELMPAADAPDTSNLVIVVTDGQENASRRWRAASLRSQMGRLNATDRWTVAWQVPPGGRRTLVDQLGIPEGNITEWEGTVAGVAAAALATSTGLGTYFRSRSQGIGSVRNFYTDLGHLTVPAVQAVCVDVAPQCRVVRVRAERQLRELVEDATGGPLLRGSVFYELTKPEKVQAHKQLMVMERGKPAIYAGAGARALIGIPTTGTTRVIPGNHGKFRIFVQSTSVNRKLVRGTDVVVWPQAGVPYKEGPSAPELRARRGR